MVKRSLPSAPDRAASLGAPTIMDRALAAEHGADYVRLCAFAIDIDRVYGHDPEPEARPLGWEVFLTECYLLGALDPAQDATRGLLEDTCVHVLDQPPHEQGLGSQLAFAVYDAVARGVLARELSAPFHRWPKPPKQLIGALAALFGDPHALPSLARQALAVPLQPPVSPPTEAALATMAAGQWALASPPQRSEA